MARCDGGYPFCQDCANFQIDEDLCDDCDNGDLFESRDGETEELSVHELKFIRFLEPA